MTPANGSTELDPKVEFSWTTNGDLPATLEVATDEAFSNIVLTRTSTTGSYTAKVLELHPSTNYYARVTMNGNTSSFVTFKTKAMPCVTPEFANPTNGGILYSDANIEIVPQDGAEFVTIQVDKSDAFGSSKSQKQLSDFAMGVAASEIKISKRNPLENGVTYYARAMVKYYDAEGYQNSTEWSDVISFVYRDLNSGISDVSGAAPEINLQGDVLSISASATSRIAVKAVNMLGTVQNVYDAIGNDAQIDLSYLASGVYVLQVTVAGETHALKMIKR